MRILFVGDVCQTGGREYIKKALPGVIKQYKVDFAVVNGENSAEYNGISEDSAEDIFLAGANVITTGNHCFGVKGIGKYLDERAYLLRPANILNPEAHGKGWCYYDLGRCVVAVINLSGTVYLPDWYSNPFKKADEILDEIGDRASVILVDFHAEATAEKRAMGYYLDGRVTAVLGTHTHVQTNDAAVLEGGTAYITDAGMTGPITSVLGIKKEIIIDRFVNDDKSKFIPADGPCRMDCVIIEADAKGKALSIEAHSF